MSIRNLIPILDLDNKIHWHNPAFFGKCTKCGKKIYKGWKILNNRTNKRALYCDECLNYFKDHKEAEE